MPRGPRRPLWLLPLLLLPLAGALGRRGPAGPSEAAEEAGSRRAWPAFQGLQERLRAAGALPRRYWTLFSCRVWPETCDQDEEASPRPLGKTRPHGEAGKPAAGWGAAFSSLLLWAIGALTASQLYCCPASWGPGSPIIADPTTGAAPLCGG